MSEQDRLLEGLDDHQRQAASSTEGPVRIVAGAGAGKTRTITRRIAYACASGNWDPNRTLAVTFSVRAAATMKERLQTLNVRGVRAATFHSAILQQLRDVWEQISDGQFPYIADHPREFVEKAVSRVAGTLSNEDIRDIQAEIDWAKVSLVPPEDYQRVCVALGRNAPAMLTHQQMSDIYLMYDDIKTGYGVIDFNDMLLLGCHILEDYEDIAQQIRSQIETLTVDEYQDVSALQHRLMQLWLGENRNVCVVGDPAQTIYGFAGASSYDLLAFDREFAPLSADIALNTDYRSTGSIVNFANMILSKSPQRGNYLKLSSALEIGKRVTRTLYETDYDEAKGVALRIRKLLSLGVQARQCAVLTRLNSQHALFMKVFKDFNIPFTVRHESGIMPNETQLDIVELNKGDVSQIAGGSVTLCTIHASKGLEYGHVFVVGCCEGLIPFGSPRDEEALEQERRLMYVAATRAEESLHVSFAKAKDATFAGKRVVSRFLA